MYYSLPELCATLQCVAPPTIEIHAALNNAGYSYSQFHHDPTAIKTNAPPSFMFDVMRTWCKVHPPEGSKHKKQSTAAAAILTKEMTHQVSLEVSENIKKEYELRKKQPMARFPPNPEDFWGPKRRAGTGGAGAVGAPQEKKTKKEN